MHDYFEREILTIERELSNLKTAAQRSSAIVDTVTKRIAVSVPLSLNSTQTTATGKAYYKVSSDSKTIVIATLDWYCEDVTKSYDVPRVVRTIRVEKVQSPNGDVILQVLAFGTQWSDTGQSDVEKLRNGQSVSINANLTVVCTDDFTLGSV